MKTALILLSFLWSAAAFTLVPPHKTSSSELRYTVFGGIDEEEVEQDPYAVGYQQQQQRQPQRSQMGAVADLSQYRDYDDVLQDEDNLNVDSFSHLSGNIMPGFHLTALCGDD